MDSRAVDHEVRVSVPIKLEACGLQTEAAALRGLAPIVDHASAQTAYLAAAAAAYAAYGVAYRRYFSDARGPDVAGSDAAYAAYLAADAAASAACYAFNRRT